VLVQRVDVQHGGTDVLFALAAVAEDVHGVDLGAALQVGGDLGKAVGAPVDDDHLGVRPDRVDQGLVPGDAVVDEDDLAARGVGAEGGHRGDGQVVLLVGPGVGFGQGLDQAVVARRLDRQRRRIGNRVDHHLGAGRQARRVEHHPRL